MIEHETFVRGMHWYLLVLAILTFIYTLYVGPRINKLRFDGAHIYYAYALIFLLSLVQIKQTADMLLAPIGSGWWYPMFCKHISLIVYLAVLDCIRTCAHCRTESE